MRRFLTTVALSATMLAAAPATARAATAWTEVSTTVDVGCSVFTYHQAADWYFPATAAPKALIYLQHGFSRSNGNMQDLAA